MFEKILDYVYPNRCVICDKILAFNSFEKQEFTCNNCKRKLQYNREGIIAKKPNNKYFDYHYFAYNYNEIIRKILLLFKFHNKKYFRYFLAKSIADILDKTCIKNIDFIVPVPISIKRYFERGYNQSFLIAKNISKYLNIPVLKYCLVKVKHNKRQSELLNKQRVLNVKNVYKVYNSKLIKGKCVLLIDDIYTTGSTVNECSRVLKEAGVNKIIVATVAKASKIL